MQPSRRLALALLIAFAPALALAQRPAPKQPAPVPAPLSAEDKVLVDRAVAYLQGLTQARGRFVQTDARGRVTEGDIYLQRPGKMRLAYDSPTDLLVVSNGSTVNFLDRRLKNAFSSYPLGATPLALFLAREIRLDRGVRITAVRRYADGFSITARDTGKDTPGELTIVFNDGPISLREWTVTDVQGQKTRVALSGFSRTSGLDPALFVLRDPRPRPGTARPQ